MAIGIIGSGFGLYGYLPAVLQFKDRVILPETCRQKFILRNELRSLESKIIWCETTNELLKNVETLIVCVPPESQEEICETAFDKAGIKNLVLEKPLAINANKADKLLQKLRGNKNFRINYSFLYSKWFEQIKRSFLEKDNFPKIELCIDWNFKAHHYAENLSNWKRFSNRGGGVINFFGIHLIAAAASLNFNQLSYSVTKRFSRNDAFYLETVLKDRNENILKLKINTNSNSTLFKIGEKKLDSSIEVNTLYESITPFDIKLGNNLKKGLDARIPYLYKIIRDVEEQKIDDKLFSFYEKVNNLWSEIEKNSIFSTE